MTNSEFIESRIKFFEEKIKEEEQEFKIMKTEDKHIINYYNNHIDILKEKKEIFEQIKTDLEAWEVVKSSISLSKNREDYKNCVYLNVINYNDKEWLILKKALEVDDVKN